MTEHHTSQTSLSDFDEDVPTCLGSSDKKSNQSNHRPIPRTKRPRPELWLKTLTDDEKWGVCDFDGTVLFVRIINGRIHAHEREALCRYCKDVLEIRGSQIFCAGQCGVYQGNFSYDLNAYLKWDGAKSYTLRKEIAKREGLDLQERDLETIQYAPNFSMLEQYEDDYWIEEEEE